MNQKHLATGTGGTAIAYTLHGAGAEQVIVMHDWNGDHTTYDAMIPYLDGAAFTYAFVDLRGYGRSREVSGEYTCAEIAGDCLEIADELGWQRFHVIGHSMTGMVTQRIAVDAPDRIKSAIAICPMSAAGSQLDEATFAFFSSTTENDDSFRRLIKYVSGTLSDQWANAKLRHCRRTVSPDCRLGYLTMFSRTDFADEVRCLQTPYLVVVADNDPGIDEAAMKKTFLAWHPNAELVLIPNCGHYPMQECPPYLATVIEKFLRRQIV
jgi:pimeloyl-ACP methyl ester carboxylesterase